MNFVSTRRLWVLLGLLFCLSASTGCDKQVAEQLPRSGATPENGAQSDTEPQAEPVQRDAERVLQQSLATASKLDKKVFVHIGAPW